MNNDKHTWEDNDSENDENVFDGEDDINQNDLLKDGTDYTDIVEKYKNRKRNTIIAIVAIAILIGVGIFFGSKYILENPEVDKPEPTTQISEPAETEIPSVSPDYVEAPNPVSDLFPDSPETNTEEITAFAENDTLQTSHGSLISIANAETSTTVHECSVRSSTDFCYVGGITLNNLDYNGYYLKNAAESSFFEDPMSFQEIEVPGATAAATLKIDTIDGSETPVLVIVEKDGTGFMFTATDNKEASLTSLSEAVRVN